MKYIVTIMLLLFPAYVIAERPLTPQELELEIFDHVTFPCTVLTLLVTILSGVIAKSNALTADFADDTYISKLSALGWGP